MTWLLLVSAALADPPTDDAMAAICADRESCTLVSHESAGVDPSGRDLQVVEVVLSGEGDPDPGFAVQCEPHEHHLVRYESDALVDHRLLLEICNDGYGASGIGEDQITVGDNRFTHVQMGGSSWRWAQGSTQQLWPERLIEETSSSFRSPVGHETESVWNWDDMSGATEWAWVRCGQEDGERHNGSSLLVPLAPPAQDWPVSGLGRCAARVDSSNATYVIHGEPGEFGDAGLSAALTPTGQLRVEVTDDAFVRNEESWVLADHLELWLPDGDDPSDYDCIEPWKARQWGIDLDGKLWSAHGDPPAGALSASVVVDEGRARFTITLPPGEHEHMTVVYSDSDDGKKQERLIATSTLTFGDAHSLGHLRDLTKVEACTPEAEMRRFWDPRFRVLLGQRRSEELLVARLAVDDIEHSTDFLAALDTASATLAGLNEVSTAYYDGHAEEPEPFEWALRFLPGWDVGLVAEGTEVQWVLDLEDWAAAAQRTPEPDDDAFVKMIALGYDNLSKTGTPRWWTQQSDEGGCSDLGNGEHLAILQASDEALKLGGRFEPRIREVRKAVLEAAAKPPEPYPVCDAAAAKKELAKIRAEVELSEAERALLR